MKNVRADERAKWGNFDLTDEQAQTINKGNVEEFNAFFFRNLEYIENRCKALFFKKGVSHEYQEGVNSVYLDMRHKKLQSAQQLEGVINSACFYSELGGRTILDKDCPHYVEYSEFIPVIVSTDLKQNVQNDYEDQANYIIDRCGCCAPSPQEEIDEENRLRLSEDVETLAAVVYSYITEAQRRLIPYFLQGYTETVVMEKLNITRGNYHAMRGGIRERLCMNYKAILDALSLSGYDVRYYENVIPADYEKINEKIAKRRAYKTEFARKRVAAETKEEKEQRLARRRAREASCKEAARARGAS